MTVKTIIIGESESFTADGIKNKSVKVDFLSRITAINLQVSDITETSAYMTITRARDNSKVEITRDFLRGNLSLSNLSIPLDIGDTINFQIGSYDSANAQTVSIYATLESAAVYRQ